jgi:hypothetical protein
MLDRLSSEQLMILTMASVFLYTSSWIWNWHLIIHLIFLFSWVYTLTRLAIRADMWDKRNR